MPRDIDLRRLPPYLRYPLALSIVAAVSALAWYVGRDRPVPAWIQHGMPALGWIYLALLAVVVVQRLIRR